MKREYYATTLNKEAEKGGTNKCAGDASPLARKGKKVTDPW